MRVKPDEITSGAGWFACHPEQASFCAVKDLGEPRASTEPALRERSDRMGAIGSLPCLQEREVSNLDTNPLFHNILPANPLSARICGDSRRSPRAKSHGINNLAKSEEKK
jgi:hypothetical protein